MVCVIILSNVRGNTQIFMLHRYIWILTSRKGSIGRNLAWTIVHIKCSWLLIACGWLRGWVSFVTSSLLLHLCFLVGELCLLLLAHTLHDSRVLIHENIPWTLGTFLMILIHLMRVLIKENIVLKREYRITYGRSKPFCGWLISLRLVNLGLIHHIRCLVSLISKLLLLRGLLSGNRRCKEGLLNLRLLHVLSCNLSISTVGLLLCVILINALLGSELRLDLLLLRTRALICVQSLSVRCSRNLENFC